ncbi:beta-glucosidase [Mycobacterium montefiorense]|uniref:Beta-glucosidase n=2 Tax=Mycobacterium montefiorense TaxID=154654 RepID=A0AA37PLG2_9MYCO|nr:glycoside hydrolase family 3 protein [Mycobacterium montefiorense]GBG37990.1 beta-glucosidase [Mycobacterium montefiorense]GKU33861.1 beta-glucosidase [Mycobacterium montefiorense]GKU41360.1 beta-glucosidase [Mycobacterium montefiorense]GKU46270.1 beta-glucosidase [Mycobacterium montefiorense]GKU52427.1 beta-glucosidase [Mycobacterium montefiorense]
MGELDDPDARARDIESQMTDDERFSLLVAVMGVSELWPLPDDRIPAGTPMSAGYVPAIPRLGIPALRMSDAGLGVTNPGYRPGDTATALPAGLALAAGFDPALARAAGEVIGREARSRGFNVQLAGAMNLARDPRNGRNFEYVSEDPLLTATIAAESVNGIHQHGVISTVKHYSLNCNETNRHWLDAIIAPDAHRESDLLAFEIAIERSQPGAVMTAYNKVNGEYSSANRLLLNDVLKGVWGYRGWVMSDWGATPSWECALHGLDQECGAQIDTVFWQSGAFTEPLRSAYADGRFPKDRLSDMVRRILRSMFAVGLDREGVAPEPDMDAHNQIALQIARQGTVLLQNRGVLPLAPDARIAVIGGYAQFGVPIGCGSSAVVPPGGYAHVVPIGGPGLTGGTRNLYLLPSSPVDELRKLFPNAQIEFDPGLSPGEAVVAARRADIAIVFGIRVEGEGFDGADLSLPWGQDAVIAAVAAANPNTVVVLETGNPVAMPWRDSANAIVQAWYPGQAGGQAIAEIVAGQVNPSGRLPITFPADLDQTPRPQLTDLGCGWGTPTTIDYFEGAEVGYRWFAGRNRVPLFAFGHGLSYTSFEYRDLVVTGGETVTASFSVVNTGDRSGADVPQLYLTSLGEQGLRLLGFERVELDPGATCRVTITADPRLLARYDGGAQSWRITPGRHTVAVAASAVALGPAAEVELAGRAFAR